MPPGCRSLEVCSPLIDQVRVRPRLDAPPSRHRAIEELWEAKPHTLESDRANASGRTRAYGIITSRSFYAGLPLDVDGGSDPLLLRFSLSLKPNA
jgi:hypothetical protein